MTITLRSRFVKPCLLALSALLLNATFALGDASAKTAKKDKDFEDAQMLSDKELSTMRGGFSFGAELMDFSLLQETVINGSIENLSFLTSSDLAAIAANGGNLSALDPTTIVTNSLNGVAITTFTDLNGNINIAGATAAHDAAALAAQVNVSNINAGH